jgi:asparagine synthase (glutamine-hydrolysing)
MLFRDSDWAIMVQKLELRVTFLDLTLLRAVTPWLAAYPRLTNPDISQGLAPKLPDALVNRPKTGFTIPVRDLVLGVQADMKESGLRGWARHLYKIHAGAHV